MMVSTMLKIKKGWGSINTRKCSCEKALQQDLFGDVNTIQTWNTNNI